MCGLDSSLVPLKFGALVPLKFGALVPLHHGVLALRVTTMGAQAGSFRCPPHVRLTPLDCSLYYALAGQWCLAAG